MKNERINFEIDKDYKDKLKIQSIKEGKTLTQLILDCLKEKYPEL